MSGGYDESLAESALLHMLADLGWSVLGGLDIGPGASQAERESWDDPLLRRRLRSALARLNLAAPREAIDEAIRELDQRTGATPLHVNESVHELLLGGIAPGVLAHGQVRHHPVRFIDWDDPAANDLLAVNQFTIKDGSKERRADVVLFVNGLPLAVIELKNPADEDTDIWTAWSQLETYQQQVSRLFRTNALLVVSDGLSARVGAMGSPKERVAAWKTVDGETIAPSGQSELETLAKGLLDPAVFLDMVRSFILYEDGGRGSLSKKIAGYHQYHAVKKAIERAVEASAEGGDRRGGVVWHTQGSGKSLTMLFFAGQLIQHPAMANPTIVMLTDRNDLDDQLFGQFARGRDLLRQDPEQAGSRADLRRRLNRAVGGVIFTTMQKFTPDEQGDRHPVLSDRSNIVVMADEAHRGQYDLLDGFARHVRDALPNATFVGFTGTPLELGDRDTRLIFGDYIDRYDIQRAVDDGATVPIWYESRLVPLELPEERQHLLDAQYEEVMEGQEESVRQGGIASWTQLEALVGTPKRIDAIAEDIVDHFGKRQQAMDGKAMIVCMSRRICHELYEAIGRIRPNWISDDPDKGVLKVVMTGSASDPLEWQTHIRNPGERRQIESRFKDPDDPLKLVIVRDMWLTGFDVPCLHTMYLDKPMKGHGLMQAIARVNRVFRDKPGGLVVDYIGLANSLREALGTYAASGGQGNGVSGVDGRPDAATLAAALEEKLDVCRGLMHGFEYAPSVAGTPAERLALITRAQEFVLARDPAEPGFRKRFDEQVGALLKVFALAGATSYAGEIRMEVMFFQTVKAALAKMEPPTPRKSPEELGHAVRQLIDDAIAPGGVVDIFTAAGLEKPDISILSESFLDDIRDMEQKNLAVEMLRKLLENEIRGRGKSNVVQQKKFSEQLAIALNRYRNRSVEMAQVIEELIELAREMREAQQRGDKLGLNSDELAFYDALGGVDMASVLGDQQLLTIARAVTEEVRRSATIDWRYRESARADMRRKVRRVLNKYGYPPDRFDDATATVVRQAEQLAMELSA